MSDLTLKKEEKINLSDRVEVLTFLVKTGTRTK